MPKSRKKHPYEKYDLMRSPFAQKISQRDVAKLVGETRDDLRKLGEPRYKNLFLVRRTITVKGKKRDLIYPVGRLRTVHERLKYHMNKIIQPSYLMSPRKGKSQRDNAAAHIDQRQYLTLDLKQFYPSTSRAKIRNALSEQFKMEADVAGLIAHVATADDHACFGSPLTPVLMALVHRPMFDEIAEKCNKNNLGYTVWVDDLTISGTSISGDFIAEVREIIRGHGHRSHKIKFQTGNRPVFITGVGVVGSNLIVKNETDIKTKDLWAELMQAETDDEYDAVSCRLLSHLGGVRYVVGAKSERGQSLASQMNIIRQKREKRRRLRSETNSNISLRAMTDAERKANHEQIKAVPF